jgi:hypothetical protein
MNNLTKIPDGVEAEECAEGVMKVSSEFIVQLRAEANRQKATKSVSTLIEAIVDKTYDPKSIQEMDEISNEFEIVEE